VALVLLPHEVCTFTDVVGYIANKFEKNTGFVLVKGQFLQIGCSLKNIYWSISVRHFQTWLCYY